MLMKDNKKNLVAAVISKIRPRPEMEGPKEESEQSPLEMAAEEVLNAIETKDVSALKESLKAMISMCMDEYEAEEEASEMSQESEME